MAVSPGIGSYGEQVRDPATRQLFESMMAGKGRLTDPSSNLFLLGESKSGKTSTKMTLMNQPFKEEHVSTFGADTDIVRTERVDEHWQAIADDKEDEWRGDEFLLSSMAATFVKMTANSLTKPTPFSLLFALKLVGTQALCILVNCGLEAILDWWYGASDIPVLVVTSLFFVCYLVIFRDPMHAHNTGIGIAMMEFFLSDFLYSTDLLELCTSFARADLLLGDALVLALRTSSIILPFCLNCFVAGLLARAGYFELITIPLVFFHFPGGRNVFFKSANLFFERTLVWMTFFVGVATGYLIPAHQAVHALLYVAPIGAVVTSVVFPRLLGIEAKTAVLASACFGGSFAFACGYGPFVAKVVPKFKKRYPSFWATLKGGIIAMVLYLSLVRPLISDELFGWSSVLFNGWCIEHVFLAYAQINTLDFGKIGQAFVYTVFLAFIVRGNRADVSGPYAKSMLEIRNRRESGKDLWPRQYGVWDFGGEKAYRIVHRVFLCRRAIYIVVFSFVDAKRQGDEEQVKQLVYWLKEAVPSDSYSTSADILLVGTHKKGTDAIPLSESDVQDMANSISRALKGTYPKFAARIAENATNRSLIFPLDNKSRTKADTVELLKTIRRLDIFEKAPRKVDTTYFAFKDYIFKHRHTLPAIVSVHDLLKGFSVEQCRDEGEFRKMIRFADATGDVRFFENDYLLSNYVLLDYQLAVEFIATLAKPEQILSENWEQEIHDGIVEGRTFVSILEKLKEKSVRCACNVDKNTLSLIISFLDRKNIIVPLDLVIDPLCDRKDDVYFMPNLLPLTEPTTVTASGARKFYFLFDRMFERTIFYRLVGLCCILMKVEEAKRTLRPSHLTQTFAELTWNNVRYCLRLEDSNQMIEVQVIASHLDSQSFKLFKIIDTVLNKVRETDFPCLSYRCGIEAEVGHECQQNCKPFCLLAFAEHISQSGSDLPRLCLPMCRDLVHIFHNPATIQTTMKNVIPLQWNVEVDCPPIVPNYDCPVFISCSEKDVPWIRDALLAKLLEYPALKDQLKESRRVHLSGTTKPIGTVCSYTAWDINRSYMERSRCQMIVVSQDYVADEICRRECQELLKHSLDCRRNSSQVITIVKDVSLLNDSGSIKAFPEWNVQSSCCFGKYTPEESLRIHFYDRISEAMVEALQGRRRGDEGNDDLN